MCGVTVAVRREPSLVRGRSVFLFTLAYVAIGLAALSWSDRAVPGGVVLAALLIVAAAGVLAPWWFVLGGPRSAVIATLEICFGRVCAAYERTTHGFVMTVPGGRLHVNAHALPNGRFTLVWFRARPEHRKGVLFRRLFAKQYRGPLPTLRIRIR